MFAECGYFGKAYASIDTHAFLRNTLVTQVEEDCMGERVIQKKEAKKVAQKTLKEKRAEKKDKKKNASS